MLTSKRNNPYTPLLLFILTLLILLLTTLLLLPLTLSPDLLASLSPYSPYPYPYPYPYPHPYSQGPQEFSTQSPPSCSCTTNPPPASSSPYTRTFYEYPPLESTTLDSTSQPPWETILLPIHGGGGIRTPNSDTGVNDTVLPILYGLGMFHQLHCLIVLRGIIFPETSQRKVNSTAMSFRGDMEGDMEHWAHCFDYLAQAALCHADDAIQPATPVVKDGRIIHEINGEGVQHRCKDARVLWEYAEQSFHDPVDMNKWDWKMGAREFLKDRFGEVPEQVPELYTPAYQVPA